MPTGSYRILWSTANRKQPFIDRHDKVLTRRSNQGYLPSFAGQNPAPIVAGWSIPEDQDLGFVLPEAYTDPNVICHKGATPGQASIEVAAGGSVQLQWNTWPDTHHGPVIDYLANCNGECTTVDKTTLKFNKIDEKGLISWDSQPGHWATDELLAAGKTWTAQIPQSVAPGNYVLRHELIGLHEANRDNGAQNYPQCINLKITGSGTDGLASGTLGTALYTPTDPGIKVDIYNRLDSYQIPGPALYNGASDRANGSNATMKCRRMHSRDISRGA